MELTEVRLGTGYSGSSINTVIFRGAGCVTFDRFQFTAYYETDRSVIVMRRDLLDDSLVRHKIEGEFKVLDAHNAVCLGVDASGVVHMAYDHHASPLRYRRSVSPLDISQWTDELPMSGHLEQEVTYPTFLSVPWQGGLILLYRSGNWKRGECRIKWLDIHGKWIDLPSPILSGAEFGVRSSNPYWNSACVDGFGRIHLGFVWRSQGLVDKHVVCNNNIGYLRSFSMGTRWEASQGYEFELPVLASCYETAQAIPPGANLMNQCGMAVSREGVPQIAYYANDAAGIPQIFLLRLAGSSWERTRITDRTDRFDLRGGGTLRLPISRPEVLVADDDSSLVIFRSDQHQNSFVLARVPPLGDDPRGVTTDVLPLGDMGQSEPVIDKVRWSREQRLTLLVQKTEQHSGDRVASSSCSEILLVDINLVQK